jgi:hypothetical protein
MAPGELLTGGITIERAVGIAPLPELQSVTSTSAEKTMFDARSGRTHLCKFAS